MKHSSFIQELTARQMVHTLVPGTEAQLAQEKTRAYIGFDPTASSLHIGNLATIMLLKHFQQAGHQPVMVVGGATGMVGDPSFKSAERVFMDRETLLYNQAGIQRQMEQFLDFEGPNGALLVNNYDWFEKMGFLQFLREVGKDISINYMMAKDSVKTRLKTGISYTEFAYQLLQGYDFLYLYQQHGVKMQMGGSDQYGNITTGIELIRKKARGSAYALTTPLITKADGSKFGKSEKGNVWLDPTMTSPYEFYQFWLNCSDEDAGPLLYKMTLCKVEEIAALIKAHEQAPHKRSLQKRLAQEVTTFVHGEVAYRRSLEATEALFGAEASKDRLFALDKEALLEIFATIPCMEMKHAENGSHTLLDWVYNEQNKKLFSSKREAREMFNAGGVRLNKQKVALDYVVQAEDWLLGTYLLVQKGRKHHYLIKRL